MERGPPCFFLVFGFDSILTIGFLALTTVIKFISGVALVVIIHPTVALNLTGALYSNAVGFQKVAQFRSTRRARRPS